MAANLMLWFDLRSIHHHHLLLIAVATLIFYGCCDSVLLLVPSFYVYIWGF